MTQRRAVFVIPADRRAAGRARREVAATLDSWGLGGLRPDAELVVSELMTNAVIHAPGTVSHELQIIRRSNGIRLAVTDSSPAVPAVRPRDDGRAGGRGLRIVATLASDWGHEVHGTHKQVWADLDDQGSSDGS